VRAMQRGAQRLQHERGAIRSLIAYPITRRAPRTNSAARYSQPSRVAKELPCVASVDRWDGQRQFCPVAGSVDDGALWKSRLSRLERARDSVRAERFSKAASRAVCTPQRSVSAEDRQLPAATVAGLQVVDIKRRARRKKN
jgi:hypothetical protein